MKILITSILAFIAVGVITTMYFKEKSMTNYNSPDSYTEKQYETKYLPTVPDPRDLLPDK